MSSLKQKRSSDGFRSGVKDKRVERTEQAVEKAYFRLLESTDYEKITISALAREAGIDRKTFYLHYGSIAELTDRVMYEKARQLVKSLVAGLKARKGDPDGVPFHIGDLMSSMCGELTDGMSSLRRFMRHVPIEMILDRLPELLAEAFMEEGYYSSSIPKRHNRLCTSFMGAGLVSLLRQWILFPERDVSASEVSALAETLTFDGLNGVMRTLSDASRYEDSSR